MKTLGNVWAVVLAAGAGTRLSSLTTDSRGNAVPKQYCSLDGGPSLLHEALARGQRVAGSSRVCAIVADEHRRYWRRALRQLPVQNVIVQPRNRGTAHGILLSTLWILEHDPLAHIVFLPADHYVRNERLLSRSLTEAASVSSENLARLVLVGISPEEPDPELGYIVPGVVLSDGSATVRRFVEKPAIELARELLQSGALWNSFIFAAYAPSLLGMLRARVTRSV